THRHPPAHIPRGAHPMNTPPIRRAARRGTAVLAMLAVGLAACGSDSATPADPSAPESSDASSTNATSPADSTNATDAATADAFPVTIEHAFGETTIDAEPQRVVSIGFAEHDVILALGVTPIAVRDWYGDQPYATWPWAQDELGDAQPEVLPSTELNFEQISALDPDVIIGINSGMSDSDYATLSQIAPTVPRPDGTADYGTAWRDQLELTGRALGRSTEATEVEATLDDMFAAARQAHPEFDGQTAAVAFAFGELPGAYASSDPRSQIVAELGFEIPAEFDELAGDQFYFDVSQENLATLDTDVIIWVVSDASGYAALDAMPLRPTLTAFTEGREIIADPLLSGAFSHGSPLSLEYVLEELVPELALAVDGDPTTTVPSILLLEAGAEGAEFTTAEREVADAWALVFDSTVPFADKADHLDDADALEPTVDAYTEAGAALGGIFLVPTVVVIDDTGDAATLTYDVLFGQETAYTALEGELTLADGVWTVSREEFCSFMASARTACS
ncbi:MAG: iron-siderophore ABC transporter substrate-binding protein, partial [Ilumatobacteraceae bacterium]